MASCFKTITTLALIAATAQMTWASSNARADETTDPYLQDATSYQLTENEYADLRAYMSQAKATLEKTLVDARMLSGYRLHKRLVHGVNVALSQSGIRHELLLFRYVLKRAIEIDQISQRPGMNSQEQALIGTSVLLRQIRIAIVYYNNIDLPRVGSGLQIPAPDWIKFAYDQIPALLRIVDEAPDEATKLEITKRALGWTAKALNTSPSRRNYSMEIVTLSETLEYLNQGINSVDQAKDALKKILPKDNQKASTSFPITNYPATDPIKPGPFFPIFQPGAGEGTQWYRNDYGSAEYHGIQIQVGLGPIVENETGQTSAAFAAASARAQLFTSIFLTGLAASAISDIRANVTAGEQPLYQVKASLNAEGMFIVGFWVGFEAEQYRALSDRIVRLGWGSGFPINIGGRDYILFRIGAGTSWAHVDINSNNVVAFGENRKNGFSIEVAATLRLGKFLLNIEGNYDGMPNRYPLRHPSSPVSRYSAAASLSYALGAIFKDDRITVEGQVVDYRIGGDQEQEFTVTTLGVNYGFVF